MDDIQKLAIAAEELRGKHVTIESSFSQARVVGHDRHFSTLLSFSMVVKTTFVAFSGASLNFLGESEGESSSFGVSLENVVGFHIAINGDLEITEHYGTKFERRTSIAQKT